MITSFKANISYESWRLRSYELVKKVNDSEDLLLDVLKDRNKRKLKLVKNLPIEYESRFFFYFNQ